MASSKFFIGTSGWQYGDWKDKFYPPDLPIKDWLKLYAKKFSTVEVNTSFYHLTRESTYQNWRKQAPKNFLFSIKLYRYLTHLKRLKIDKESLKILKTNLKNISGLKNNLGAILIQLPPGLKFEKERLEKFIREFLRIWTQISRIKKLKLRTPLLAVEFRHKSWLNQETYKILKKYKIAFCISDSPKWNTEIIKTADWVYVRFHGKPILFASLYSKKELRDWAKKIKTLKPKKAFIYFNNDFEANAVKNALELLNYFKTAT